MKLVCDFSVTSAPHRPRRGWRASSLFGAGEVGAWYDPSDMSTLFQDAAGATAVTSAGQSVGLMLDKGGAAHHASQSVSAARPTLRRSPDGGVRNLLTYTEDLNNAAWGKVNATGSGSNIMETAVTGQHYAEQSIPLVPGSLYTVRMKITGIGRGYARVVLFQTGTPYTTAAGAFVELATGSLFNTNGTVTASANGTSVWITLTGVAPAATCTLRVFPTETSSSPSFTGDPAKGVAVEDMQMELGSTTTANQKVVSAYDVTEVGKRDLWALSFDGVDDFLTTSAIDLTATDAMSVFAAFSRPDSAATNNTILEFGPNIGSTPGSFRVAWFWASPDHKISYASDGTGTASLTTVVEPPASVVFTGQSDISEEYITQRVNAVEAYVSNGHPQTGGNYSSQILYLGARAGTSNPFKGDLFGLMFRGATSGATDVGHAERYLATKSGVTL